MRDWRAPRQLFERLYLRWVRNSDKAPIILNMTLTTSEARERITQIEPEDVVLIL